MPVFRWTLSDTVTGETYTFENNPHDSTPDYLQKNVSYYGVTADDTTTILYEGVDQPQQQSFVVSCLTETFFVALRYWYSKRRPFIMTDDLGNQWPVYWTQFQPVRKQAKNHPWYHEVTVQYFLVGQQAVTTL